MRTFLIALCLAGIPVTAAGAGQGYACNMSALTKEERAAHEKVSRTLFDAVRETKELKNGYAFRLPRESLVAAAQWVDLERKCCPFFVFEMEVGKDGGPLWLRLTGDSGIKPFIRSELGI